MFGLDAGDVHIPVKFLTLDQRGQGLLKAQVAEKLRAAAISCTTMVTWSKRCIMVWPLISGPQIFAGALLKKVANNFKTSGSPSFVILSTAQHLVCSNTATLAPLRVTELKRFCNGL